VDGTVADAAKKQTKNGQNLKKHFKEMIDT